MNRRDVLKVITAAPFLPLGSICASLVETNPPLSGSTVRIKRYAIQAEWVWTEPLPSFSYRLFVMYWEGWVNDEYSPCRRVVGAVKRGERMIVQFDLVDDLGIVLVFESLRNLETQHVGDGQPNPPLDFPSPFRGTL